MLPMILSVRIVYTQIILLSWHRHYTLFSRLGSYTNPYGNLIELVLCTSEVYKLTSVRLGTHKFLLASEKIKNIFHEPVCSFSIPPLSPVCNIGKKNKSGAF